MSRNPSHKRPSPNRRKAYLVCGLAVCLSGAAFSAHATVGGPRLEDASRLAVAPEPVQTLGQTLSPLPEPTAEPTRVAPWWPPRPRPTVPKPTTPATSTAPSTATPTTTTPTTTTPTTPPPTTPSGAAFPGLVPGQFYLGMSCGTECRVKEGELGRGYGIHRQFKKWGDWAGFAKLIQADQKAGRLPWISFKGPIEGAAGWRAIASGAYDADLRQLAKVLKANDDQPLFLTFHHEPNNDGAEADGVSWAGAYVRIHDVLAQAGALENVADPPIVSDWLFDPRNRSDPADWLTPALLRRAPFLGIDLYENATGESFAQRVPRVLSWLASQGYPDKMVGIGETGSTDYYSRSTAVKWMNDSLRWAAANTDKVVAVSYFNSMANSRPGVYWPLDESDAKMAAYRTWLNHAKTID